MIVQCLEIAWFRILSKKPMTSSKNLDQMSGRRFKQLLRPISNKRRRSSKNREMLIRTALTPIERMELKIPSNPNTTMMKD